MVPALWGFLFAKVRLQQYGVSLIFISVGVIVRHDPGWIPNSGDDDNYEEDEDEDDFDEDPPEEDPDFF